MYLYDGFHAEYDYDSTVSDIAVAFFVGGSVAPPPRVGVSIHDDGVAEEVEGLVVLLEVVESELDERDVGQVDLIRSTYLGRINPSGMNVQYF